MHLGFIESFWGTKQKGEKEERRRRRCSEVKCWWRKNRERREKRKKGTSEGNWAQRRWEMKMALECMKWRRLLCTQSMSIASMSSSLVSDSEWRSEEEWGFRRVMPRFVLLCLGSKYQIRGRTCSIYWFSNFVTWQQKSWHGHASSSNSFKKMTR